jgi:dihydrofolate reductase
MRKLIVFNQISIDGYIADLNGDMSWAHKQDEEWNAFVQGNAGDGGELVFGRITYEMMASYWPTPFASENNPIVASQMNSLPKVVFSTTLNDVTWNNTRLFTGDLPSVVRRLKDEPGQDMVIFGSGSIISQLTEAGLIDEYQFIINPVILGKGKSMFETITNKVALRLASKRIFQNGNVLLCYVPLG